MTIHFVYSALPGVSAAARLRGKASRLLQKAGLPLSYVGGRDSVDTSAWPFRAPLSITHHVLQALRGLGRVKLYDWAEKVGIRTEPGDILIGHPHPGGPDRVWNRACLEGGFAARIALVPIHHGLPEICSFLDPYVPLCDRVLGITGPYWWSTWGQSAFSHWLPKITPVDMAIDVANYPRVKKRFNPKGKRKFLFIGNGDPYKGAHLLSLLFGRAAGTHSCVWVGADRPLPHLEKRPFGRLGADAAAALAEECDVFLTMGTSDANPTTILEAMAWGFPVACTPQSGYHEVPCFGRLSTTDMVKNLELLRFFQEADESELMNRADAGRKLVEEHYHFRRMCETVISELKPWAPGPLGRG